jgi:hypothetical protein
METKATNETKSVFKVIFAWEDEKEEKWLEQMAASGWHLKAVAPYFYQFQRGDPEVVTYRLDYKVTTNKDYAEYATIFRDSGWELVSVMANWHYYRIKPENQSTPEIYNSARAKAQKYRRLLVALLPFLPVYFLLFNPYRLTHLEDQGVFSPLYDITIILMMCLLVLMSYAVIRIGLKIRKLESQSKE